LPVTVPYAILAAPVATSIAEFNVEVAVEDALFQAEDVPFWDELTVSDILSFVPVTFAQPSSTYEELKIKL